MDNSTKTSAPVQRFQLGQVVLTPGAIEALAGDWPAAFLIQHELGNWGEVCEADKRMNDAACAHEGDPERQWRVLSQYRTKNGATIWIITEADRSVTTILLPAEY